MLKPFTGLDSLENLNGEQLIWSYNSDVGAVNGLHWINRVGAAVDAVDHCCRGIIIDIIGEIEAAELWSPSGGSNAGIRYLRANACCVFLAFWLRAIHGRNAFVFLHCVPELGLTLLFGEPVALVRGIYNTLLFGLVVAYFVGLAQHGISKIAYST